MTSIAPGVQGKATRALPLPTMVDDSSPTARRLMTRTEFDALRKQAKELHATQGKEKEPVSIDAIFSALALDDALTRAFNARKPKRAAPPSWVTQTLAEIKKDPGKPFTVQRFLILAGKWPADRSLSIRVGRWLRDIGVESEKVGGNMLFSV